MITFDRVNPGPFGNNNSIPQDLGDRVTAAIDGDFSYGTDHGFTPNVVVDWNTGPAPDLDGFAVYWGPDFGDLTGVIEAESEPNGLQFTLTADAGHLVQLHGFDMAGWPSTNYTINAVRVRDGNDNILFEQLNATILGAGPSHSSFDFAQPLTAQVIKIEWDSTNLGGNSDNIGMDNIAFGQIVPEPASIALITVGTLVALRRRSA